MDEGMDGEQKRQSQTVPGFCLQGDSLVGLGWVASLISKGECSSRRVIQVNDRK